MSAGYIDIESLLIESSHVISSASVIGVVEGKLIRTLTHISTD